MVILRRLVLGALAVIDKLIALVVASPPGKFVEWLFDLFKPVIQPTRAVLILIIPCGLALAFTDQGRELARSLPLYPFRDLAHLFDWVLAFTATIGAMTWWAVQSWWWARILLDRRVNRLTSTERPPRKWLWNWTPRAYAMLVYAIAIIPLAMDHRWGGVGFLAVVALLVLWILVQRRNPASKVNKYLTSLPVPSMQRTQETPGIAAFAHFTRLGLVMLALSLLLPAVMGILLTFWRNEVTFFLGTLGITFIAMACILPAFSLLTISQASSRAPVLAILAIYVFIVGAFNSYFGIDNHTIRSMASIAAPVSSSLEREYEKWLTHNPNNDDPLILVYSAGGGLRAAYWTSALLSDLEAKVPGFHCRVFAVSGVSGGSVGAVFWAGALQATGTRDGDPCKKPSALGGKVNESLARDYLASGLSGLLFNDLLSSLVPFKPWWKDRAVALEEAWEAGFAEEFGEQTLANGFHSLWSTPERVGWMPVLLLNGTHQETGQRIITSNIAISEPQFPKAFDFFKAFDREIAASTAALNSARFTYVSPAGRIVNAAGKEKGHVIDGGYFENYGARTISDLAVALKENKRRVLLIEMINDTDLEESDADRCGTIEPEDQDDIWAGTANEIVAPIKGMLMARQARGVVDARMATQTIAPGPCEPHKNERFFQFRLCPGMNPSPPLGWVMGEKSVENIGKLIQGKMPDTANKDDPKLSKCVADMKAEMAKLLRVLPSS